MVSSAPGTHAVTAASTGDVKFSAKSNNGSIINMNCTSVTGNGTVTSGSSVNLVAEITSTTWSGCGIPGGAFTFIQSGAWNLVGTGGNATPGTETIPGYLGNMTVNANTTSNPKICKFTVTSTANGSFDEATQQLKISETGYTGNLRLSNVSGCLGQLQNGNPFDLEIVLNIKSPDGAINLS